MECWQHPLDLCTKKSLYCLSSPLERLPFFFQYSSHTHSFKAAIASNKPSSPILNFFNFLLKNHALGISTTAAIFQNGVNMSPICCLLNILRTLIKISKFHVRKPSLFAFVHVADMCIPAQVMCDCYEGPAKSLVTGFGLLQCYVLSNIFLLQTFKVFPLY